MNGNAISTRAIRAAAYQQSHTEYSQKNQC